ncbi:hypothetical protein ACWD3I_25175 [Streptomyces sp. NPDC002817]|uniref:hypothetical protein n=1 Tax=Streptomyces sp. NPDC088357 TaxID=3154655 RepID=UPI0034420756
MRRSTEFLLLAVAGTAGGSAFTAVIGSLTPATALQTAITSVIAATAIVYVRSRLARNSQDA